MFITFDVALFGRILFSVVVFVVFNKAKMLKMEIGDCNKKVKKRPEIRCAFYLSLS